MTARWGVPIVFAAALLTAACNGPGADQAAEAARSFEQLATSDATKACDLLAPKTRDDVEKSAQKSCPEALGDEDLADPSDLVGVEVYGHDAIAQFVNDTVFLAKFDDGWRVTAASCRPGPSDAKPYDCDISGG